MKYPGFFFSLERQRKYGQGNSNDDNGFLISRTETQKPHLREITLLATEGSFSQFELSSAKYFVIIALDMCCSHVGDTDEVNFKQ